VSVLKSSSVRVVDTCPFDDLPCGNVDNSELQVCIFEVRCSNADLPPLVDVCSRFVLKRGSSHGRKKQF
jgi:hypothetical protein